MIDKDLKDKLCSLLDHQDPKERFLTRNEAVERFEQREGADDCGGDISGFFFTLAKMELFIAEIKKYNCTEPEYPVEGIRIWQAKSDEYGALLEDVVITPTRKDGSDIHAYGDDLKAPIVTGNSRNSKGTEETLLILGSSRPCPNLCGPPREPAIKFFHQYQRPTVCP